MKKIIVIGLGGSGKSYFSKKLSKILNIPVFHFDCINKRGYKTMMKAVLKSFKMEDVNSYFFSNKPKEEFSQCFGVFYLKHS